LGTWRPRSSAALDRHFGLARADAFLVQSSWQQETIRTAYGRTSRVARMLVEEPGALGKRNTSDVEGFPNTYLRAWIRGLPVVATFDPDGIVSREGLGARVFDTGELAEAVSRILGNRADFEGMRRRCLQYMAAHYKEDEILYPYLRAMEAAVALSSQGCGHRQ